MLVHRSCAHLHPSEILGRHTFLGTLTRCADELRVMSEGEEWLGHFSEVQLQHTRNRVHFIAFKLTVSICRIR
jgi:hypothetical protein